MGDDIFMEEEEGVAPRARGFFEIQLSASRASVRRDSAARKRSKMNVNVAVPPINQLILDSCL
jgi:hypothetical protein